MLSAKWRPFCLSLNVLTHWILKKMATIIQTFSTAFSWTKIIVFWLSYFDLDSDEGRFATHGWYRVFPQSLLPGVLMAENLIYRRTMRYLRLQNLIGGCMMVNSPKRFYSRKRLTHFLAIFVEELTLNRQLSWLCETSFLCTSCLTSWGLTKIVHILQTISLNAFLLKYVLAGRIDKNQHWCGS